MFDFLSSSDKAESRQRRELFLDGSTPYSIARTISTSHTNRIKAKNGFKLTVPQKIYTDFNLEVGVQQIRRQQRIHVRGLP